MRAINLARADGNVHYAGKLRPYRRILREKGCAVLLQGRPPGPIPTFKQLACEGKIGLFHVPAELGTERPWRGTNGRTR